MATQREYRVGHFTASPVSFRLFSPTYAVGDKITAKLHDYAKSSPLVSRVFFSIRLVPPVSGLCITFGRGNSCLFMVSSENLFGRRTGEI